MIPYEMRKFLNMRDEWERARDSEIKTAAAKAKQMKNEQERQRLTESFFAGKTKPSHTDNGGRKLKPACMRTPQDIRMGRHFI